MNDTLCRDHVAFRTKALRVSGELGDDQITNAPAVSRRLHYLAGDGTKRLDQVAAADNPDQVAILNDGKRV